MACGHLREFGMSYKSWPSCLFLSRWVGQEGQQEGILRRDLWRKLAQTGCVCEGLEAGRTSRRGHLG